MLPVKKALYAHALGDVAAFTKVMQKGIKENGSLEDFVAMYNAEMEARGRIMAENMRKAGNGKTAAKTASPLQDHRRGNIRFGDSVCTQLCTPQLSYLTPYYLHTACPEPLLYIGGVGSMRLFHITFFP